MNDGQTEVYSIAGLGKTVVTRLFVSLQHFSICLYKAYHLCKNLLVKFAMGIPVIQYGLADAVQLTICATSYRLHKSTLLAPT